MLAERRRILTMLHEGKITVDEAEELLDALAETPEPAPELKVEIIGESPKLKQALSIMDKAAKATSPVLIVGEHGTGKELAARYIHQKSARCDSPFIAMNCAATPEALIESELFGHERGAFTGAISAKRGLIESAYGGILFLDEITALSIESGRRLQRVIADGETRRVGGMETIPVDVRIIAATNRNLGVEANQNRFDRDLFYSLSVITITMPPLREMKEDIPLLAEYFLKARAAKNNRAVPTISDDAIAILKDYSWPGNVRELATVIERALVFCEDDIILPEYVILPPDHMKEPEEHGEPLQNKMRKIPASVMPSSSHQAKVTAQTDTIEMEIIRATMSGTFYRSPSPDDSPFVTVGDEVRTGDVLCLIEAMTLFNPIKAEFDCYIVEILVENSRPVEDDQPLFKVRRKSEHRENIR
ncbi:AAA family ATPase [Candidatus Poribacteria bacterium]|nr:AAA family ATPase [Candidatus Poribacteria bacterium]